MYEINSHAPEKRISMNQKPKSGSDSFYQKAIDYIKMIPEGKVSTYGRIAALAGNPHGARQVVRILHTSSGKEDLPWQRVINREGHISLRPGSGYEVQKNLLLEEGIEFDGNDTIDFEKFLWSPFGNKP